MTETIKVGIETTTVDTANEVEIENPGIRIDDPIDAQEVAVGSDAAARKIELTRFYSFFLS